MRIFDGGGAVEGMEEVYLAVLAVLAESRREEGREDCARRAKRAKLGLCYFSSAVRFWP